MILPISILIPYQLIGNDIYVWVQKRVTEDDLAGLLEFPGGKIEMGESPEAACVREVHEETGMQLSFGEVVKYKNFINPVANKKIMLMTFLFQDKESRFSKKGYFLLDSLLEMTDQIPPANKEILLDIKGHF